MGHFAIVQEKVTGSEEGSQECKHHVGADNHNMMAKTSFGMFMTPSGKCCCSSEKTLVFRLGLISRFKVVWLISVFATGVPRMTFRQ